MTLFRVVHNKSNPYLTINTTIAEDSRLSAKAKGIWFYAFSRPDDWQFYEKDLVNKNRDSRDSIRSGLKELEECGYLVRPTQKKQEDGKFSKKEWFFFEIPLSPEEIQKMFPMTDFPSTVNHPLLNKKETNKKKTTTTRARRAPTPLDKRAPSGGGDPPPDPAPVVVSSSEEGEEERASVKIKPAGFSVRRPAAEKKAGKWHEDLDLLSIDPGLKQTLSEKYNPAMISRGVLACLEWTKRKSDAAAIVTILSRMSEGKWEMPKEHYKEKNLEKLSSIKHLDGKKLGDNDVCVGYNYIEFTSGSVMKRFDNLGDSRFWDDVCKYVNEIKSRMLFKGSRSPSVEVSGSSGTSIPPDHRNGNLRHLKGIMNDLELQL